MVSAALVDINIVNAVGRRVEMQVSIDSDVYDIYFYSPDVDLELTPEAVVTGILFPFMAKGLPINIQWPLDSEYSKNIDSLQDIFGCWFRKLNKVSIQADLNASDIPCNNRIGAFYSGGLDSFYTLEKHQDKIDDLIFVHGYDVGLGESEYWGECIKQARSVAKQYGKNLVEVETNLRDLLDQYIDWGFSHGAAFATVAHLLGQSISCVYIASSYSYSQLFPWGSHPLADPLWSSSRMKIVHDGCEATRVEKANLISDKSIAMNNLRVCWENVVGNLNCGICEKCIRTMINFEVAGSKNYQQLFPVSLSPELILSLRFFEFKARIFATENLAALEQHGKLPEIKWALKRVMARKKSKFRWQRRYDRLAGKLRRAGNWLATWPRGRSNPRAV